MCVWSTTPVHLRSNAQITFDGTKRPASGIPARPIPPRDPARRWQSRIKIKIKKKEEEYPSVYPSLIDDRVTSRILIFSMKPRARQHEFWLSEDPKTGWLPAGACGPRRCQRGRERWSINIKRLSTCRVVIVIIIVVVVVGGARPTLPRGRWLNVN